MDKKNTLKKEFNGYKEQKEKQKLIDEITGIEKQRKNISKAKSTPKPKQRIKNIWWLLFQDTPAYLKKAPAWKSNERIWSWNQTWKVSSW